MTEKEKEQIISHEIEYDKKKFKKCPHAHFYYLDTNNTAVCPSEKISELIYKFVASRPEQSVSVYFSMLDETATETFMMEDIIKPDGQYLRYCGNESKYKQLHKIPHKHEEKYLKRAYMILLDSNSDFVDFVNSETSKNK